MLTVIEGSVWDTQNVLRSLDAFVELVQSTMSDPSSDFLAWTVEIAGHVQQISVSCFRCEDAGGQGKLSTNVSSVWRVGDVRADGDASKLVLCIFFLHTQMKDKSR